MNTTQLCYNHLLYQQFTSSLSKLGEMKQLPSSEKRHLAVAIMPAIEKEYLVYTKLKEDILAEHADGKDDKGNLRYKDAQKLNKKLEELHATKIEWFPRPLQITPEVEKELTANDLFALSPIFVLSE